LTAGSPPPGDLSPEQRLREAEREILARRPEHQIVPTLDRIAAVAPRAGVHLHASIRTGRACRYEPGPGGPAGWDT